ncbi:TetR/AcrR family transcriptional regulator [Rhodococcus sp. IEGM 1307]|uniref:TetR/AcrR family transcriptional regulator n=1 Tax=Rhodococcus sp. IEGM 1307 TaxID=3047091 RepID=UPI0024B80A3A|nr:TetR/AcrR family transcriptional regulator [Rhodococcus sp. IEGM 1307]MDI9978871.1 TetR/AcrR family transcriptional regulator [Rhodococcus sp. IEGM 1307]
MTALTSSPSRSDLLGDHLRDGRDEVTPGGRRASPLTRADIVDAALTHFADRGFHGTSLKDVAHSLHIRPPSLYHHIESKASLLAEIVLTTLDHVADDFETAVADTEDPIDKIRRAVAAYARRHATHPRETRVVNQESRHLEPGDYAVARLARQDHEHRFRSIISHGVATGAFDVDCPRLASFAIREMCVSIARWFRPDGELTPSDVADLYSRQAVALLRVPR